MTLEEQFAELVEHFATRAGVGVPDGSGAGRGFGSDALRINGSIFAMITRGRLVLKLPARRVQELIAARQGDAFDAGKGRPMREWVEVRSTDAASWRVLATEAADFVGS